MRKLLLLFLLQISLATVSRAQAPVIFFTDLDSGPNSGGESVAGYSGAYVTIFGNYFGTSQGNSSITLNGTDCLRVVSWGNPHLWYQTIVVQLGPNCTSGIFSVTVNGYLSSSPTIQLNGTTINPASFTVRLGNIRCVSPTGSDSSSGLWPNCQLTVPAAVHNPALKAGDIIYVRAGVTASQMDPVVGDGCNVCLLETGGTLGNPIALSGYPGEAVTLGTVNFAGDAIRVPNSPNVASYWTIANLNLQGNAAIGVGGGGNSTAGWRVVGNDMYCPKGTEGISEDGCFEADVTKGMIFNGNKVHDTSVNVAASNISKLYHAVYWSTDSDGIDVGWNEVGNSAACRGVQFHSSPTGVGSGDGHQQYDLHVHNNYIHDIRCDGINFATVDPSKGTVEAYDNLIVHTGMGPDPADGPAVYSGIYFAQILNAGSACSTNCGALVYNNTLYNNGSGGTPQSGQAAVSSNPGPVVPTITNNLIYQTGSEPYLDIEGAAMVCDTNLFFGTGAPPSACTHSMNADPLFAADFTDFHLQTQSPPDGAGVVVNAAAYDLDGYVRANPTSLGAYEYQSGSIFALRMSPQGLSFGNSIVGNSTAPQTVSMINTTSSTLNFSTISISGDFAETDNCAPSLAPGSNCTFSVTFSPVNPGTRTGFITIADDNASAPTQSILLSGIGVSPPVTPTPLALGFGSQNLNTTSPAQTITIPNTSVAPLSMTSIAITGDFAQTNSCGQSVAGSTSCTISVTFTPKASGNRTGSVTITDSAANSPQAVTLTGTGTVPNATLSPKSLSFGSQSLGTTSAAQSVNLSNTGTGPLTISNITISGDYAETSNCVSPLAAASNCTITITFTPSASGSRTGTLTITDNGSSGSTQTTSLSGTGAAAAATVAPSSLTFGSQLAGTTSGPQSITLAYPGLTAMSITSISISGNFAQTNNCGTSLSGNGSCFINVTFTPTASGTRTGTLTIKDSAANSPQTVGLTGTGTAPAASLSPASVSFGNQNLTTTSAAQTVTLSNTGTALLSITAISVSGDFGQSNNCVSPLAPGSNCAILATFKPSATGNRTGTLTVKDNSGNGSQSVSLSGTGTAPIANLSMNSISFGTQRLGTPTGAKLATLKNTGNLALAVSNISSTSPDFIATSNCGASLAPSSSCTISVIFDPVGMGARTGQVMVSDNAANSPQSISLSGTGQDGTISFSVSSLTFPTTTVGNTSASQTITLTNTGTASMTLTVAVAGDFSQTNKCGSSLSNGKNCTITVTFKPTATGPRAGSVAVTSTQASNSPQSVQLTGTGK